MAAEQSLYSQVFLPRSVCCRESHGRKKNCNNVWCPYGLGEHKVGIWDSKTDVLGALMPFAQRSRVTSEIPAGLNNLGATCYVNVILQSMFHIKLWVTAILESCEETHRPQELSNSWRQIRSELSTLLHELFASNKQSVIPRALIKSLELDTQVQQDPEEFLSLFSTVFDSTSTAQQLFEGREAHSLHCPHCEYSSQTVSSFSSLKLNISETSTLNDALQRYISPELMDGIRMCPKCHQSGQWQRRTTLDHAPDILLLHLLRYDFDRETLSRKKIQNKISFSDSIEVNGEEYALCSVIYHLGGSALGGHYVCECKDWTTGRWFHCDDGTVENISADTSIFQDTAPYATADAPVIDLTTQTLPTPGKRKNTRKRQASEMEQSELGEAQIRLFDRRRDCYMFFYVRRSAVENEIFDTEIRKKEKERELWQIQIDRRKNLYDSVQDRLLPQATDLNDFVLVHADRLRDFVVGNVDSFLRNSSVPSPVNRLDRCEHGKILPSRLSEFKILSCEAYETLTSPMDDSGIPSDIILSQLCPKEALPVEATKQTLVCEDCFQLRLDSSLSSSDELQSLSSLVERWNVKPTTCSVSDRSLTTENTDENVDQKEETTVEVSSAARQLWLSKKAIAELKRYIGKLRSECSRVTSALSVEAPTSVVGSSRKNRLQQPMSKDAMRSQCFSMWPLNADLQCPHDDRAVDIEELAIKVDREDIQALLAWDFKCLLLDILDPSDEHAVCPICMNERLSKLTAFKSQSDNRKLQRANSCLISLLKRNGKFPKNWKTPLQDSMTLGDVVVSEEVSNAESHSHWHLINSNWMSRWRAFMRSAASESTALPLMDNSSLFCKHGQLLCRYVLSDEIEKADRDVYASDLFPSAELVSVAEWDQLRLYNAFEEATVPDPVVDCSCTPPQLVPGICVECTSDTQSQFERNQRLFSNASISIVYFKDEQLMRDFIIKRNSGLQPTLRSRGSTVCKFTVDCDHSDTLSLLKLKIFQNCGCVDLPPGRQRLFTEFGIELRTNRQSLFDIGITHVDKLFVILLETVEGGEWLDCLHDLREEPVEGFGVLSSNRSSVNAQSRAGKDSPTAVVNLTDD